MTLALRAAGSVAGGTSPNPAVPTGTTTGDISILTVIMKPYDTTITTPSGWTKIGEWTNGTVANGTDTGSVKVGAFYRESASVGAIGAMTLTGANTAAAIIHSYSKDSARTWDLSSFTDGADTTNGANFSATGNSGLNVQAGDIVCTTCGVNGDIGTPSAFDVGGMSGATLGTDNQRNNNPITTGNDCRLITYDTAITAGSSNAAPTFTYTNASNTSGTVFFLRLREVLISSPGGIASAEAFGTPTHTGELTSTATGIATAETFGSPTVQQELTVTATGIASAEAFGSPTATLGAGPVVPDGIASAEAFGTPTALLDIPAAPTGIASAEAFGTPTAVLDIPAAPTSIASAEAFGTPAAVIDIPASPTGIPSGEAFGTPTALTGGVSSPTGIPSAEAFGTPAAVIDIPASPVGIPSGEAFGSPGMTGTLTVAPVGISTAEAFGVIVAGLELMVLPVGIGSAEAFGIPEYVRAKVDLDLVLGTASLDSWTAGGPVSGWTVGVASLTDWEAGE